MAKNASGGGAKKMKMQKQIAVFAFAVLLLASMMAFAIAEENEINLISSNPQTVDQETVNAINDELNESAGAGKVFMEKVKSFLTFNQEKKAEQELKLAKLELIRVRIAAKNNNTIAMEKAIEAHNAIIAKIQARIYALDGKATKQGIKDSAAKLVGLERAIEVHEARIAKLNEILASENLSEEQIANIQARLDQAINNTAHLKEVEAAKTDSLKTRIMAVANMTEEQANAEIQKLEDAQNLSAVKKMVAEVKAVRAENAANVISRVIEKLELRQNETGQDLSNAIAKLAEVQQNLETRSEVIKENAETVRAKVQKMAAALSA
jgi:vacuolar-type H+-ATPase subunit I/STV1